MTARPPRVLQVLAQRPGRTGSGVTLEALVRGATRAGFEQRAVVGTDAEEPRPAVAGLPPERVHALTFSSEAGAGRVPFPVVGMSDVMPYASRRWSSLEPDELATYRDAWRELLGAVLAAWTPDVIHVHHGWVLAALVRELAPGIPTVVHVHGTELRQLELAPAVGREVLAALRGVARFACLHGEHAARCVDVFGCALEETRVVGAGFDEATFRPREGEPEPARVLFAGKLSRAKGVASLLDAFARVRAARPEATLHLAGGGAGAETDELAERIAALDGAARLGVLPLEELVREMRAAHIFVLPSFYEGLPLVLVEAAACGARLVATDLPGVRAQLAEPLGATLRRVALPAMRTIDEPDPAALPDFAGRLADALLGSLDEPPASVDDAALAPFRWSAVAERVAGIWRELAGAPA